MSQMVATNDAKKLTDRQITELLNKLGADQATVLAAEIDQAQLAAGENNKQVRATLSIFRLGVGGVFTNFHQSLAEMLVRGDMTVSPYRLTAAKKEALLALADEQFETAFIYDDEPPPPDILAKGRVLLRAFLSNLLDEIDAHYAARDIPAQYDKVWRQLQAMLDIARERGEDPLVMQWNKSLLLELQRRTTTRQEKLNSSAEMALALRNACRDQSMIDRLVPWREALELLAAVNDEPIEDGMLEEFKDEMFPQAMVIAMTVGESLAKGIENGAKKSVNEVWPEADPNVQ
jgi:hypothetical protein